MARQRRMVTATQWARLVANLDDDTREVLNKLLNVWKPSSHVEYTVNSAGQIDSDSNPVYSDGQFAGRREDGISR